MHTHPVGVGVAAFLVGGAIGATVGGALVARRAEEEIQRAKVRGALDLRNRNVPKQQQLTAGRQGPPYVFNSTSLYT